MDDASLFPWIVLSRVEKKRKKEEKAATRTTTTAYEDKTFRSNLGQGHDARGC